MKKSLAKFIPLIAAVSLFAACSSHDHDSPAAADTGKPVIAVASYPMAYFAERIAGNAADIRFPVPEDVNPVDWQPDADDIRIFQEADLILFNGAQLEDWSSRVTLPSGRVVNTSSAFRSDYIVIEDAVLHHHGDGHYHSHDGYDPHTWLDPVQAIRQADAAHRAIANLIPDQANAIGDRHGDLDAELKELHTSFLAATEPFKNYPMLASHPVYDYFARRYQLDIRSLHLEPELFPSEEEWQELDELLEEQSSRVMLWEDYPLADTITELSNRGISVIVFHTCISKPDDGDFMDLMRANARRLSDASMVIE